MSEPKNDEMFWLDNWEGVAEGGYFIRNNLFKFLDRLKESGLKPVGIVCDGTWNLEIIVEKRKQ